MQKITSFFLLLSFSICIYISTSCKDDDCQICQNGDCNCEDAGTDCGIEDIDDSDCGVQKCDQPGCEISGVACRDDSDCPGQMICDLCPPSVCCTGYLYCDTNQYCSDPVCRCPFDVCYEDSHCGSAHLGSYCTSELLKEIPYEVANPADAAMPIRGFCSYRKPSLLRIEDSPTSPWRTWQADNRMSHDERILFATYIS
jgi:hypothetical protein